MKNYSIPRIKSADTAQKKETVNTALEEFIERRKSEELIQLFGTIEYHPSYNYKKMRLR